MGTLKLQDGLGLERHSLDLRVRALIHALDAAIRGVPKATSVPLGKAVDAILADGPVAMRLTPQGLIVGEVLASEDLSRVGWLMRLYMDGVRALRLSSGLEQEVDRLVSLLRHPMPGEDLVTRLWSAAFRGLQVELETPEVELPALANRRRSLLADCHSPEPGLDEHAAFLHPGFSAQGWLDALLAMGPRSALPTLERQADAWIADEAWPDVVQLLQRLSHPSVPRSLRRRLLTARRLAALAPVVHALPEKVFPPLAALAEDSPELAPAIEALVAQLPTGPITEALVGLLQQRGVVLTGLWLRQLGGADPERARGAFDLLRLHGGRGSLLAALRSPHGELREAALLELGAPSTSAELVRVAALLDDKAVGVRVLAARYLMEASGTQATRLLLEAAQAPERSTEDRVRLVRALGERKDIRVLPWLAALLEKWTALHAGDEVELQLAAVDAMHNLDADEAREMMRQARRRWVLAPPVRAALDQKLGRAGA